MRIAEQDHIRRLTPIVCTALSVALLWMVLALGAVPAGASSGANRGARPEATHTTTTTLNPNTAVKGKKEGPVAVVLSFIGVIAVVVLIVALGSVSVRRRTRDSPGPGGWREREPPDHRRGFFG
jgi:hypothetical protein